MSLFLMVMRSGVSIVSRASERNNAYVASDRSAVGERYYREPYEARHLKKRLNVAFFNGTAAIKSALTHFL